MRIFAASRSVTSTSMSTMGLSDSLGSDVLPKCSIRPSRSRGS